MHPVLIVPGLGNSGPQHWQRLWQAELGPRARAVEQADWDRPDFADWIARLDAAIATSPEPPVLVAHSLSCALVAHWSVQQNHAIAGAMLVAPADVDSDAHTPPETRAFRPMPTACLLLAPTPWQLLLVQKCVAPEFLATPCRMCLLLPMSLKVIKNLANMCWSLPKMIAPHHSPLLNILQALAITSQLFSQGSPHRR